MPGPEVLGGRVHPRRLADVVVDQVREQRAPEPAVLEGQQPRVAAPAPSHPVDGLPHRLVVDLDAVLDSGLADEPEHQRAPGSSDVPALQRGQAEAAVLVGVHVVADPEVAQVQQPYGDRTGPFQRHPVDADVGEDLLAGPGERAPEGEHPVELLGITAGPPVGVVEVLPSPGRVGADGLQVPVGIGTDPHVLPRGRDHQRPDPLGVLAVEAMPVAVEQHEAAACSPT